MEWCCIAAVNDPAVLEANLAASPVFKSGMAHLSVFYDQPSASLAYNRGIDNTYERICVFAHQDVYLPLGWIDRLAKHISFLDQFDPEWAVVGVFGIGKDGDPVGRVWSTGIGREIGKHFETPLPVQSLDELVIVLNRESGLKFDPDLPNFHLYATDIVQTALSSNKGAYVVDAPVVHNSIPTSGLRGGFAVAYDYVRIKWRERLPVITPVTKITRRGWYLRIQDLRSFRLSAQRNRMIRIAKCAERPDPKSIAIKLGYEAPS